MLDPGNIPNSLYWLEEFKRVMKIESDKEVADFLGVSKQAVSHWRTGKHQLGQMEAIEIGACIGVNPLYVGATSAFHASPKPEKQAAWLAVLTRIEPLKNETLGLVGKTRSTSSDPENTKPMETLDTDAAMKMANLINKE